MAKKDRYIVGLDIGTTKICILVAELRDDGTIDITGVGQSDSKGLRKGVIINVDPTVDAESWGSTRSLEVPLLEY